ncbi:MAG: type II secretion system protein [Rubrivivax sp.]
MNNARRLPACLSAPHARLTRRARQRGVTMLFGLIALAIMLIGAAAMVRSMNTSLANAGNLGFKRDLTNQTERGMLEAIERLNTGGVLGTEATRQNHNPAQNYSASILPTNPQGVPTALIDDAAFTATWSAPDIDVPTQGVRVRYLIDRLCVGVGAATPTSCSLSEDLVPAGSSSSEGERAEDPPAGAGAAAGATAAVNRRVVYRVSVRVSGPRNTQAFFQTTLTPP